MRWHDKFDSWQSICSPVCSCCVSPDVELTLLAFALARGSVAKVIQALSCISDHLDTKYKASPLIVSMASVRLRLLYRNGNVNGSSFPLLLFFFFQPFISFLNETHRKHIYKPHRDNAA